MLDRYADVYSSVKFHKTPDFPVKQASSNDISDAVTMCRSHWLFVCVVVSHGNTYRPTYSHV